MISSGWFKIALPKRFVLMLPCTIVRSDRTELVNKVGKMKVGKGHDKVQIRCLLNPTPQWKCPAMKNSCAHRGGIGGETQRTVSDGKAEQVDPSLVSL